MKPTSPFDNDKFLISGKKQPVSKRSTILFLVTVGTIINYLHRIVIGVGAPAIAQDLGLSTVLMGFVFSAFSWTYALFQIPGGFLLDRLGNRLTYLIALASWSLFTMLHGAAVGLKSLLFFRCGLGLGQSPCFPANARIIRYWFPQEERARSIAVFTVGEYLVLAFFEPLLFWILTEMGWRALFIIAGSVGLFFYFIWYKLYSDPQSSYEETSIAKSSRSNPPPAVFSGSCRSTAVSDILTLLKHRQILGLCLGGFAGNTTLIFFLTWFPTYLVTECRMEWIQSGFFSIFPFLAAATGVMTGGWFSDYLLRRKKSLSTARKLPILVGLFLAANIMWANYADNNIVVVGILSIAFFGQGMTGLGWVLVADIAPTRLIGLTGGICNFSSNIAGICTPIVIGFIVSNTGSFHYALIYISSMAILGVCSYLFILGDVIQIETQ